MTAIVGSIIAASIGGAFLLINTWLTVFLYQMAKRAEKHHAMNGTHKPERDEGSHGP